MGQTTDPFVAEAFTYLCLSVAIIALRSFIRIRQLGVTKLFADDYFMIAVLVPYATETALAYLVGANYGGLSNSGMTDEERRMLDPLSEEYQWRVSGSKIQVAGWPIYVSVLWGVKASLCTFYARLTDGVTGYHLRIRAGYVLLAVTYVGTILTLFLSCQPLSNMWQIYPDPGNLCQPALSKVYIFVPMILNVLTDVYLVIIPISMLWGAKIPTYKKLSLIVLFSGALFVMTAGVLRSVLILRSPITGPRQGSAWACRESFVAVFTANLPVIWGWLKPKLRPMFGSLLSSNSRGPTDPGPDSFRLADKSGSGRWRTRTNERFQTHTTTTVIRGGDADDESDSSIKGIIQDPQQGITKDVTVSVSVTQNANAARSEDSLDELEKDHLYKPRR